MTDLLAESDVKHGDHFETVAARGLIAIGFYSQITSQQRSRAPHSFRSCPTTHTPHLGRPENSFEDPHATLHIHRGGHFEPYVEPRFPIVIEEQLKFFKNSVPQTV